MNDLVLSPFMIPLGGMLMVAVVLIVRSKHRINEKELVARQEMQIREMEHQQKMKAMELELAKVEAAKSKTT